MKFSRFTVLVLWTMGILLVSCICFVVYIQSLEHNINRIQPDSPLLEIIRPEADYNNEKIRSELLIRIQIGATREQIETFLKRNFTEETYPLIQSGTAQARESYILVRAIDIASLVGGESVDIFFVLDDHERLKDIAVKSKREWL